MKKAEFLQEVKHLWNGTKEINGHYVARVVWEENPWKVLAQKDSFDTVTSDGYEPVAEFHRQEELWQYLKNN